MSTRLAEATLLPSNRPRDRFYRGGAAIAAFRGEPDAGDRVPEDWVASTTTVAGEASVGLTVLPAGGTLRDVIEADPVGWLGADHVARFGSDTRLLVKLLHAGQRLPVHAHPDGDFAARHLGRAHGKAEAWYILHGGEVLLGLNRDITPAELAVLVERQDVDALHGLLHRYPVAPGDVVFVPPGVLHAIGEGVLLVELQEPEDLSILVEWRDFALDGARDGHLGLGFDIALGAIELRRRDETEGERMIRRAGLGTSVLPASSERYFRLERRRGRDLRLDPGFAVLVVVDGGFRLGAAGQELPTGSTAVVPHSFGSIDLVGDGEVLVCRPPV